MHISSKCYYGLRALFDLAVNVGRPTVKIAEIASRQRIPPRFLEMILAQLKQGGFVESRRGADGGYRLARPASEVTLADVIRAIDGPLAGVSGARPETLDFQGHSEPLRDVWIAVRASLRAVLEHVTLADVATGELPDHVRELVGDRDAWLSR